MADENTLSKHDLSYQKRLASKILKCSPKRIRFVPEYLEDISNAMTREDIKGLIRQGVIFKVQKKGVSRVRARELHKKKKKGQRRGAGSRKGKATARSGGRKRLWIMRVRAQRKFIKDLISKKIIPIALYRKLYRLIKGGFFRSRRHIEIYLKDSGYLTEKQEKLVDQTLKEELN